MTEYLSSQQIEAYRTLVLPVDELLRLDRLLAEHADRGAMLARDSDWELADLQLRSVHRAAIALPTPHLLYEDLEGWVDGSLSPESRALAEGHLRRCPMCLAELRDFISFAAPMAQPVPVVAPPRRIRTNRWAGSALALAATVILGIGMVQMIFPGSHSISDPGSSAADVSATRAVTHVNDFDYGVFDRLVLHADGARAAYLKNDYSIMATELAARAGQDPQAASALGLVYTAGLVPSSDTAQGVRLLTAAAQQGDAYAQYNLGVAYERGIGMAADSGAARRWYRAAATQNLQSAKDAIRD